MNQFADPEVVARYADGPPRLVPGFESLQRMALILLSENTREDSNVLVLGAGGGLEIKAFAAARPHWRFTGIDPSAEMLNLARSTLQSVLSRVSLQEGYIDTAPEGPFDAASCLLTMHFIAEAQRLHTLEEIRHRLRPGAPFVMAHLSFSQAAGEREQWLARYAAFARSSGVDPQSADNARAAIGMQLPILSPEREETLLLEAGFSSVQLFYAGFAFRGWVAYA